MPRIVPSLAAIVLVAITALSTPTSAEAQCWSRRPCARGDVYVAPRGAYVRVGRPYYYPPSGTVIVTVPPPTPPRYIIVEAPPPPPHYVIVEPPQEPVVTQAPQPEPEPAPEPPAPAPRARRRGRVGIHGSIGGIAAESVSMGGFAAALRLRPTDHFAFDLGVGAYSGEDWNGQQRLEVPITLDLLAFVNPRRRLQLYFVLGVGASAAFLEDETSWNQDYDPSYTYLGGTAGIGLEWRLGQHFALNADARGFLRRRVDSDEPEFVDGTRETNTSAGLLGNLGATVYF